MIFNAKSVEVLANSFPKVFAIQKGLICISFKSCQKSKLIILTMKACRNLEKKPRQKSNTRLWIDANFISIEFRPNPLERLQKLYLSKLNWIF